MDSEHGGESKDKLIETLYSRIGELSVANEFLKKTAVSTFSERKVFIEPKHPQLSIVKHCDLLCLNRSSIYYKPATESGENLKILRWLDNRY